MIMNWTRLDDVTWVDTDSGIVVTDNGPGTALTVIINGNARQIPIAKSDRVRALMNYNPTIAAPSPNEKGLIDAGVSFWDGKRTPKEMNGGTP